MKMKPEDYAVLEAVIRKTIEANPGMFNQYKDAGLSGKRYRWDLLWKSGLKIGSSVGSPGDLNLYDYLNDDHIDTALRKITGTN